MLRSGFYIYSFIQWLSLSFKDVFLVKDIWDFIIIMLWLVIIELDYIHNGKELDA